MPPPPEPRARRRSCFSSPTSRRRPESARRLLEGRRDAAIAVSRYDDGNPFALSRTAVADLADLRGDTGVRRVFDQRTDEVDEVTATGRIPVGVHTEEDYDRVRAELQATR